MPSIPSQRSSAALPVPVHLLRSSHMLPNGQQTNKIRGRKVLQEQRLMLLKTLMQMKTWFQVSGLKKSMLYYMSKPSSLLSLINLSTMLCNRIVHVTGDDYAVFMFNRKHAEG